MYKHFVKPTMDFLLALIGSIVLIPVWLILSLAIFIDNPGPIFFTQKRVRKRNRKGELTYFKIIKFRTMKTSTPKDTPTHLLENPDRYITRVGRLLRKTSLDELPQIFCILTLRMSIIGPRPALWNQDDLVAERDKYGVNDIKPGLTGWAQINGRDELEIPVKAALDGEYVERMSFLFDCKCFFGTIKAVFKHDGVVEGGTGEIHKQSTGAEAAACFDNDNIDTITPPESLNDNSPNDINDENTHDVQDDSAISENESADESVDESTDEKNNA